MTNKIRELAFAGASTQEIRRAALSQGMTAALQRRHSQSPERHHHDRRGLSRRQERRRTRSVDGAVAGRRARPGRAAWTRAASRRLADRRVTGAAEACAARGRTSKLRRSSRPSTELDRDSARGWQPSNGRSHSRAHDLAIARLAANNHCGKSQAHTSDAGRLRNSDRRTAWRTVRSR